MSDGAGFNRVAIVTGGASGIGRATAMRLAREGATVVVCDVDRERAKAVAAELDGESIALELDVSHLPAWERSVAITLEQFGSLDVLVNCAGILLMEPLEKMSLEGWSRTLAVNLDGTIFGCLTAISAMRGGGGGSIVNFASVSSERADETSPAYCTSKGAVLGLTEEIACQCARRGDRIRCNAILPGTIRTPMTEDLLTDMDPMWLPPIGRLGQPEDIAALVAFLCSDDARSVNGAGHVIDGGFLA